MKIDKSHRQAMEGVVHGMQGFRQGHEHDGEQTGV
jgi:hypothetical protein